MQSFELIKFTNRFEKVHRPMFEYQLKWSNTEKDFLPEVLNVITWVSNQMRYLKIDPDSRQVTHVKVIHNVTVNGFVNVRGIQIHNCWLFNRLQSNCKSQLTIWPSRPIAPLWQFYIKIVPCIAFFFIHLKHLLQSTF